jgi:hypothetical protein
VLAAAVLAVLAANFVNHQGAITVQRSCPLQVSQVTLNSGKGFDRDSIYANFFITNSTKDEFLYTYTLQLRSGASRTQVSEQVASTPILPHSKGWYREFVSLEFTRPDRYTLDQSFISCVKTTT